MRNVFRNLDKNPLFHRIFIGTAWRGVYPTFAAAQAGIPRSRASGYNNPGGAAVAGRNWIKRRRPTNYAAFFHLGPLIKPGMRIFDFGGGNGAAYYSFRQYLHFPADLIWTVCDVSKVIEVGRQTALEQQAESLRFTERFEDADNCDLLYSAGALQYVETGIAELVSTLGKRPPYILLNRVPVWDRGRLFTLQSIDSIVCPYQIFNRSQLIGSIEELGYRLMDDWECPESTLSVRFRPSVRLDSYQGFFFALPSHPVTSVLSVPGKDNPERKDES